MVKNKKYGAEKGPRGASFSPSEASHFSAGVFFVFKISMDDKEYYSLMNRSSSWALQQALKKKNSTKKTPLQHNAVDGVNSYSSLEARQGRADAEMLMEKKSN